MDSTYQLSPKPSSSLAMKCPLGKMEYHARFGDFWRWQKSSHIQDSVGKEKDTCFSFQIFLQKWPQAVPRLLLCGFLCSDCTLSISNVALDAPPPSSPSFNVYVLIVPPLATTDTSLLLGRFWWYLLLPLCPFVLNCAQRKLVELSLPGGW